MSIEPMAPAGGRRTAFAEATSPYVGLGVLFDFCLGAAETVQAVATASNKRPTAPMPASASAGKLVYSSMTIQNSVTNTISAVSTMDRVRILLKPEFMFFSTSSTPDIENNVRSETGDVIQMMH